MSESPAMPGVMLAGGNSGDPAGVGDPGQLELALENLLSGAADVVSGTGVKTLILTAGEIASASTLTVGAEQTASEVANNLAVLAQIAAYCTANGIGVEVDAVLTDNNTYASGINATVDMWAKVAAAVGLPIKAVQDVQEIGSAQPTSSFASYAPIEANSIRTLIADYASSSYTLTVGDLAVGDMEGAPSPGVTTLTAWFQAYDAVAAADGLPAFSYLTADTNWFAPWIGPCAVPTWQANLEAASTIAAENHMALDVLVQGTETDASANQFVMQAEQNAADLAMLQASGSIDVGNVMIQSWYTLPIGVGMITSPTSSPNEAAEIGAVYPLYEAGSITAQGSLTFDAPGQVLALVGTAEAIVPLSVSWDAADVLAGNRLGVVIIDQTGALTATQYGSGTVSDPASNILILSGDSADLAAELRSVTLTEPSAGADTIDVETYGVAGRLSDEQISVFAAAPGQPVGSVDSTNDAQGWLSASAVLNTGSVITSDSTLTSEILQWSTTGTLTGTIGGPTTPDQTAFLDTVSIHEPLAEYGVENVSSITLGTAASEVLDINDPTVDNGVAGGFANNPGVNDVGFAPLPSWLPASFNADAELTPLIVQATTNTFDPVSGQLEASVNILAPDPLTVVDLTGTHPDTLATAFNNGGSQVTEFNTGDNAAWQPGWSDQFSSATLTYDGAGQLVELFLQGGPNNPLFTIDDVFDPNTGQLWEQFQTTDPPPVTQGTTVYATTTNPYQPGFDTGPMYVTQFNTGNNPNWDIDDWGSAISSDTEVWTDYMILENFAGLAVNFPGQYCGALNAYPYKFVNGSALDLLYLPGTNSVNLNALGTVTIESQTMVTGLSGLDEIDAAGATGTVNIAGLLAGGSTLIGGDNASTITGYGHDTIVAGAGLTTIDTGAGGSTILVSNADSDVTVSGPSNTITAVAGSTLSLAGNADSLIGSGVDMSMTAGTTSLTVIGNSDTVAVVAAGGTVFQTGVDDVMNYLNGGTLNQDGAVSTTIVNGNSVVVWMSANGGTVAAVGNDDRVTGGANAVINVTGNNDVVGVWPGATVTVSGQQDIVAGSSIAVAAATSSTSIAVVGNSDTVTAVAGSTTVIGNSDTVAVAAAGGSVLQSGANDVIDYLNGGTLNQDGAASTAFVNGNSVVVWMSANGGTVAAVGNDDRITGGVSADINVTGNNDVVGVWPGATIAVSGQQDIVAGSSIAVAAATSSTSVAVVGNCDTVTAVAGSTLTVTGTGETLNGSGVTVYMTASTSATLSGNDDEVNAASGDAIQITGSGETVRGSNMAISVNSGTALAVIGSSDTIGLVGTGISLTVSGNDDAVSVVDTAADVASHIDALEVFATGGQLKSISLTDSGTPSLILSAEQVAADAGALASISSPYELDVTTVTAANAADEAGLARVALVSVSDTAAKIAANLGALQMLATSGKLGSITFTDSGTPILVLSPAQIVTYGSVLSNIVSPYIIDPSAAEAPMAALLPNVLAVAVDDTAANVVANLGALETLAAEGRLSTITFTDSGTPTVILSAAQIAADAGALARISSPYELDVTTVTAANATDEAALAHVALVSVSDTAANITANLSALQMLATSGKLGSITFTDSGTPNLILSAARLSADSAVLAHISGPYTLEVAGGDNIAEFIHKGIDATLSGGQTPQFTAGASDRRGDGPRAEVASTPQSVTGDNWFTPGDASPQIVRNGGMTLDVGLNQVIKAMTALEQNYTASNAYDPTHLASAAITDQGVLAAVSFVWHDMHEPETIDPDTFVAEVDSRFDQIGDGLEAALPESRHLSKQPPQTPVPEHPAQRTERLRKRLSAETVNLADAEVLELVLAPAMRSQNAELVAQRLLAKFGTFGKVIHAAAGDLLAIEGLEKTGVVALKAVGAAALHMLRRAVDDAPRIRMWDDLKRYLIARLQDERVEVFFVIFLNRDLRVISDEELSRGTIDHAPGYPREIVRRCLELDATNVILVHNHPAGSLNPSRPDVNFTHDVIKAGNTLGIAVLDHIIVGHGECISLRANKFIPEPSTFSHAGDLM